VKTLLGCLAAMSGWAGFAAVPGLARAEPPDESADAVESESKRLLKLYLSDAEELKFFRDAEQQQRLVLQVKPVYIWQNRIRSGGQFGAVYVWTFRGCPELVGSIFSNPTSEATGRAVLHEFHTLAGQSLYAVGGAGRTWSPRTAVKRQTIPDAPTPAESPKSRLVQLRALARDFSAHSISPYDEGRWELRLLTQPLYRYESTDPVVVDGAVFAYVTSAGTDPEVLLVLEARKIEDKVQWVYAAARFSDFNLFVEYKERQVWQSLRDDENPWEFNKDRTYRLYTDRIIEE
jgi:hypothetical protein